MKSTVISCPRFPFESDARSDVSGAAGSLLGGIFDMSFGVSRSNTLATARPDVLKTEQDPEQGDKEEDPNLVGSSICPFFLFVLLC